MAAALYTIRLAVLMRCVPCSVCAGLKAAATKHTKPNISAASSSLDTAGLSKSLFASADEDGPVAAAAATAEQSPTEVTVGGPLSASPAAGGTGCVDGGDDATAAEAMDIASPALAAAHQVPALSGVAAEKQQPTSAAPPASFKSMTPKASPRRKTLARSASRCMGAEAAQPASAVAAAPADDGPADCLDHSPVGAPNCSMGNPAVPEGDIHTCQAPCAEQTKLSPDRVSNVSPAANNSQPAESFSFGLTRDAAAAHQVAEPPPSASVQRRSIGACATSVPAATPAGGSMQNAEEPVSVHFGRFAPLMSMPSQVTGLTAAAAGATPAGPSGGSFTFPDVSQVSNDCCLC